jgi:hypothetical protein
LKNHFLFSHSLGRSRKFTAFYISTNCQAARCPIAPNSDVQETNSRVSSGRLAALDTISMLTWSAP